MAILSHGWNFVKMATYNATNRLSQEPVVKTRMQFPKYLILAEHFWNPLGKCRGRGLTMSIVEMLAW